MPFMSMGAGGPTYHAAGTDGMGQLDILTSLFSGAKSIVGATTAKPIKGTETPVPQPPKKEEGGMLGMSNTTLMYVAGGAAIFILALVAVRK